MKKIMMLLVVLMALTVPSFSSQPTDWTQATSWSGSFTAGSYDITDMSDGRQQIEMTGFSPSGAPGDPQLPCRIYNIALPPTTNFEGLTIQVQSADRELLPGTYDIVPAPPCAAAMEDQTVVSWGDNVNIVNGKNTAVYGADAFFGECLELLPASQMRKWRFARVKFCPFEYNPVTGQLALTRSISFSLVWPKKSRGEAYGQTVSEIKKSLKLQRDKKADRQVADFLYNTAEATVMYDQAESEVEQYEAEESAAAGVPSAAASPAPGAVVYDYVIITTNAIESNLTKLGAFVTHLTNYGFSPLVVTEDDYGSLTGQSPNGTAEKIRQWLINNYVENQIEYVLLIGNPHPDSGDVPMKMCHPYSSAPYTDCPTDYFFADLTGNWDLNADLSFGTYANDRGTGGVDFSQEVAVGRIPLVSANYSTVDGILQKIMDYENATGDLSWREKILLPMAESNHTNEDMTGDGIGDGYPLTDGRDLPEDVINGYATANGFSHYVFYEKAGLEPVPDSAAYDNATHTGISTATVVNEWQNGYGCVLWWGHGSETSVARKYWNTDDGDGVPEAGEMAWYSFFTTANCASLDDSKPSIVYQDSCLNGYPENANNLGYALLKQGAVATVSASRVSWYMIGNWYHSTNPDNANIGFVFMNNILSNNDSVGTALFTAKNESYLSSNWWGGQCWMNRMDFNLYGAPHVRYQTEAPPPVENPANLIDWNGNLVADFGANGMWYHNGTSWNWMTNSGDVGRMVVWDGKLVADFGAGKGLYYYDGTWHWMTNKYKPNMMIAWDNGTTEVLVVDFGSGERIYTYDGSWNWFSNKDAVADMTVWNNKLIVDFGAGRGVYNYDTAWHWMTNKDDVAMMLPWNNGTTEVLVVDFGGGRRMYTYNGAWNWFTNKDDVNDMEVWNGKLVVDFGAGLTMQYYDTAWHWLSNKDNVAGMTAWYDGSGDNLAVDFGAGRNMYNYSTVWTWIKNANDVPEMLAWNNRLAVDFGSGVGVYNYNGSWNQMKPWSTAD